MYFLTNDNNEVIDARKYLSVSDPALLFSLPADLSSSAPGGPGATFHHRRIPTKLTSRQQAVQPGGQMEECYFMTVIYHIHNPISTIQSFGVPVHLFPLASVPFSHQPNKY